MKVTGRPCDSASCCANSSRFSVPPTFTSWAVIGVNSERVDSSAARWKISSTWNSARMRSSTAAIEDRAGDLAVDLRGDRRIESASSRGDDRALGLVGQTVDQAVADLAVGAGDEHDRFAHGENYTEAPCLAPGFWGWRSPDSALAAAAPEAFPAPQATPAPARRRYIPPTRTGPIFTSEASTARTVSDRQIAAASRWFARSGCSGFTSDATTYPPMKPPRCA